jgi:hypothetical protein
MGLFHIFYTNYIMIIRFCRISDEHLGIRPSPMAEGRGTTCREILAIAVEQPEHVAWAELWGDFRSREPLDSALDSDR